ncbi:uncharacterized protein LOC120915190 [Rana temporaria]|uniref:uncharacterized protein LOC120915190 n=1 Tax=Rana temporaria TaxID=8407 RepID=UPI001AADB741|nr:uncharacterized protein LOC120915190 [Rana temporaria]
MSAGGSSRTVCAMEALIQQLIRKAEGSGGAEWIQHCLSLPDERSVDASSVETAPAPGPSEPSSLQPFRIGEAEFPTVFVPGMTSLEAAEEEEGVGQRTSKRRRSQRRSVSPAQPGTSESCSLSPLLFCSSQSTRPAAPPGGRGRNSRSTTEASPQPCSTPGYVQNSRRGGRGGRRNTSRPTQQTSQQTSQQTGSIPVRCEVPAAFPGAQSAQGLEGHQQSIWILGHSFIFWAQKRAADRTYSENLGLDPSIFKVNWYGRRGMVWDDLVFELGRLYAVFPPPDILVLHLGGNDIGKVKTYELVNKMKDSFQFLKMVSPHTVLVFSEIVPRLRWLESLIFKPLEKVRKRINKAMEKFLSPDLGFSFRHRELEGGVQGLYRADGVHLSEIGLDIFNTELQTCIEAAAVWGGGDRRAAIAFPSVAWES